MIPLSKRSPGTAQMLVDDVLDQIAHYCCTQDLRRMRAASRAFCALFTAHAFREIDICFHNSWLDAISLRLNWLEDQAHAYLVPLIRRVVVRFKQCDSSMASSIVSGLIRIRRLENVRELHMVLEGSRREWLVHGFTSVVARVCDVRELRQPQRVFRITFSDILWPFTTLSWSDIGRSCTLLINRKTFHSSGLANDAALWVPYPAVETVVITDVHIDRTVLPFLPLFGPNSMHGVRRLVLHRVYLVVDAGVRLNWAAIWDGAREHWPQLVEVDIEACGYTRGHDADGDNAMCMPPERMSASVLEEDEVSLRKLKSTVHSRHEV